MKLADHSTIVSRIRNQLTYYRWPVWKTFIPIACIVDSARVESTHETCPARRTDRTLAEGMRESRARANQFIEYGGAYKGIAQGTDCVEALLVGAVPEDIRSVTHLHYGLLFP